MDYTWSERLPDPAAFLHLYNSTGWNERRGLTADQLSEALAASYHLLGAYDGDDLVGFGRLVSDGIYQCFLCDVIVLPEYQGRGLGKAIVERLVDVARRRGIAWLQLSCARGKRGFYERLGFAARPDDAPGMEIWLT